jgi:hypothetical protein
MIKAKLYMNVHWMVIYKVYVFCSDMKFKMAATAGLSLTLDPMGTMFQNASSLNPLGQLKQNWPGMIIGRSSTKFLFFYADRKFKMAATAGHRLTLDPNGKMFKCLLLRNYKYDQSQTVHECSLDGHLQSLRFLFRYEIQNGGYGRT